MRSGHERMLLVGDAKGHMGEVKELLECQGYRDIEILADAETALALLGSKHFHLVLIDHGLPKTSGLALLESIRMNSSARDVPVIFLADHMTPELRREAHLLRVGGCYQYPVIPTLLSKSLYNIFRP